VFLDETGAKRLTGDFAQRGARSYSHGFQSPDNSASATDLKRSGCPAVPDMMQDSIPDDVHQSEYSFK
jgi:hypothetical protein